MHGFYVNNVLEDIQAVVNITIINKEWLVVIWELGFEAGDFTVTT